MRFLPLHKGTTRSSWHLSEPIFISVVFFLYSSCVSNYVRCENIKLNVSSTTTSTTTTSTTSTTPVPSTTSSSSNNEDPFTMKCDFNQFKNGCPDPATTICDKNKQECLCRPGIAVRIGPRCMSFKSVDEPCYSSKECDQIGAKCINAFGEVDAFDNLISRPLKDIGGDSLSSASPSHANIFFNLYAGFCQCPVGFYHNQDKKKCQRRLIGTSCRNSTDCNSKPHVFCDPIEGKCLCDHGYSLDMMSDQCKMSGSAIGSGVLSPSGGPAISTLNAIDTRHLNPRATPICEYGLIWDQSIRKCVPLIHWENNRTWSALVWKVAVLCVVLVLLMMLASGIQRARQNENLINWSRALELYAARSGVVDPDALSGTDGRGHHHHRSSTSSSSRPPHTGVMLVMPTPPPQYSASSTREISLTVLPSDDPPTYEEAIRQSSSGDNLPPTATTTTTTIMMINSTSGPSGGPQPVVLPTNSHSSVSPTITIIGSDHQGSHHHNRNGGRVGIDGENKSDNTWENDLKNQLKKQISPPIVMTASSFFVQQIKTHTQTHQKIIRKTSTKTSKTHLNISLFSLLLSICISPNIFSSKRKKGERSYRVHTTVSRQYWM